MADAKQSQSKRMNLVCMDRQSNYRESINDGTCEFRTAVRSSVIFKKAKKLS
jgi:hypothetical protein